MSNTPKLGLPEFEPAQALPDETANDVSRRVEQGAGLFIVADKDATSPPGSPADGVAYIVAASATGAWSGHDGEITYYQNTAWEFITPSEGFFAWVSDEDTLYHHTGSAWTTYTVAGALLAANDLSDLASAPTALTNLGATTTGGNLFTVTNPSAITFLRVNADNSVSLLSASAFRTAIGAGTGSGSGDMLAANNLSDLANAADARANLGVAYVRVAGFATTAPGASEVLLDFIADTAFTLAANLAGTKASVGSNPAATFALDVQKNGSTIGTISISTGGVVTLSTTSGTSKAIAVGDVISVVAPATPDASIARLRFTLQGTL